MLKQIWKISRIRCKRNIIKNDFGSINPKRLLISFFFVKSVWLVFFVFFNHNWIQKSTFPHYEWSIYAKFDCLTFFLTDWYLILYFHEQCFHCLLFGLIFVFDLIDKTFDLINKTLDLIDKTFEVFNKTVLFANYSDPYFLLKSNSKRGFFFKTFTLI